MRTRTRILMALFLVVALVGCHDVVVPTAPPPIVEIIPVDCNLNPDHVDCQNDDDDDGGEEEPDAEYISGAWRGIISDQGAAFVSGVWNASITQSVGAAFVGTWASATGSSGTMSGAVQLGQRISGGFTYTDAVGTCSGLMDGTATATKMDVVVIGFAGSCSPIPTVLNIVAGR